MFQNLVNQFAKLNSQQKTIAVAVLVGFTIVLVWAMTALLSPDIEQPTPEIINSEQPIAPISE